MMNWTSVFHNNLRRSLHKKSTFYIHLILPIVIVILSSAANVIAAPSLTIGILGEQNDPRLVENLSLSKGVEIQYASESSMKVNLITGRYTAVLTITEGGSYTVQSLKDTTFEATFEGYIEQVKRGEAPLDYANMLSNVISIGQRSISFIVLFLMITATLNASLMIKDKVAGTFQRYCYAPQSMSTYNLGNIIYNFAITYFQYIVSISVLQLLNQDLGIRYLDLLIMGIWIAALATSFATLLASLFKKELHANLAASSFALIFSLIGGSFISYQMMPKAMQVMSQISPMRWFMDIVVSLEEGATYFVNQMEVSILSGMILVMLMLSITVNKKRRMR